MSKEESDGTSFQRVFFRKSTKINSKQHLRKIPEEEKIEKMMCNGQHAALPHTSTFAVGGSYFLQLSLSTASFCRGGIESGGGAGSTFVGVSIPSPRSCERDACMRPSCICNSYENVRRVGAQEDQKGS